ncbi:MAG: protein-tyrosine-phosphatase [Schleiferiaceae bacterium]|nr:protein-tyrosine-phosphatase [Schleiferiaceae bacterium]
MSIKVNNSKLESYISGLDTSTISNERQRILKSIAKFIKTELNQPDIRLNFICTHNSRRSQLAQIWNAVFADLSSFTQIQSFSGGTVATAFHPNAVAALERTGLHISVKKAGDNPTYGISWRDGHKGIHCWSKVFGEDLDANENFAAIMTCSDADENCPYIPNATVRIPLRYKDPKVADGRPDEATVYDQRCEQIATEMKWLYTELTQSND